MSRDSFVFYHDWKELADKMQSSHRLQFYDALIAYAFNEEAPPVDDLINVLLTIPQNQIDRDAEKYESIKKKRSEAGKKHRGNQYSNGTNGTSVPSVPNIGTNGTVNVNDNVNVNVNVNDNVNNIEPKGSLSATKVSDTPKAKFPKDVENIIYYFNQKANGTAIKPVSHIRTGSQFHKSIQERVREYGEETVREAIDKALQSQFLNGYNNKGWQATADWIFLPNNFQKIYNGNYDGTNTQQQQMSSKWANLAAEAERVCREADLANQVRN